VKVAVLGAGGYAGSELLRLLTDHPGVSALWAVRRGEEARSWPQLAAAPASCTLEEAKEADLIFMSGPHGAAQRSAGEFLDAGVSVIDLSADFRLPEEVYAQWYGPHAAPQLQGQAVYGFPELDRAGIAQARLVANPGCYVTAVTLALQPAARAGWIAGEVVVSAASGVSGAGRNRPELSMGELAENFRPYAVTGHRHLPEMERNLKACGYSGPLLFLPHLLPMARGILASISFQPSRQLEEQELFALYQEAYAGESFLRVQQELPETKATLGSNRCDLSLRSDPHSGRVLVFAALDNLVKGAAGQAIQNFNLMCGLPETSGLPRAGLWP
jgi:N-acetyl-gamma-glutamyl-phosphate reductase